MPPRRLIRGIFRKMVDNKRLILRVRESPKKLEVKLKGLRKVRHLQSKMEKFIYVTTNYHKLQKDKFVKRD